MPSDYVPSRTFNSDDLEKLYALLSLGDLLEFRRPGYAHWAVYVGIRELDGKLQHCVIHRAVPADADETTLFLASQSAQSVSQTSRSQTSAIGEVYLNDIRSVLENDGVRINNSKDKEWRAKEAQEIVARAEAALNATYIAPYSLFTNNCEHFANSCRYGKSKSHQVSDTLRKGGRIVASVVVPIATSSAAKAIIVSTGIAGASTIGWAITGVSLAVGIVKLIKNKRSVVTN